MKEADFDRYVAEATTTADWRVANLELMSFPFYDITTRAASLAYAYAAEVQNATEKHIVVVALRQADAEPDYAIWCGDKFLEAGGLTAAVASDRCTEAVTSAGAPSPLVTKMLGKNGAYPASDACTFWLDWRRSKELCKHTTAILAHLRDTTPDFKNQLAQGYEGLLSAGTGPMAVFGDTLELEELAFRVPVLFEGDRGAGKTVTARAFARENGYLRVELGGHEGIESLDLLGFTLQAPNGTMVWKDGPLSEAFRKARTTKVVLIIDELLRIRMRELSILLTAFSPDLGMYRLRTGRVTDVVDGVACEEELECPVANLCVVATTNVGAEYAVDEMDPALAERFVVLRKDTSEAELKRILGLVAKDRGIKPPAVTKCISFYKKMVEANLRGLLARTPTTRTLVRALELAKDENGVVRALRTQTLLWVARTSEGKPVPEQVTVVNELLAKVFK